MKVIEVLPAYDKGGGLILESFGELEDQLGPLCDMESGDKYVITVNAMSKEANNE